MANVPDELMYSTEHEWVAGDLGEGDEVTVGITEHAADALGDIVYLEGPSVGDAVVAGEMCGEIESTKAVSELYSPVSGTVVAVNEALAATPEDLNRDPYGAGWIFKVELTEPAHGLLSASAYGELTG